MKIDTNCHLPAKSTCCSAGDGRHHRDLSIKPTKEWFCPMCSGVESDKPGDCPKCGMALESRNAQSVDENTELRDLIYRFKIGLILTFPVVLLAMGAHVPGLPIIPQQVSYWSQFAFSTPVVF